MARQAIYTYDGHEDRYKPLLTGDYFVHGGHDFRVSDWGGLADFEGSPFDGVACVLVIGELRVGPVVVTPAFVGSVFAALHAASESSYAGAQRDIRASLGIRVDGVIPKKHQIPCGISTVTGHDTIDELDIGIRAYHALANAGKVKVSEILSWSASQLMEIPKLGVVSAIEVMQGLREWERRNA